MMPSVKRSKRSQRGVALFLALIIVFVLSALAAAMIFVTQTDIVTTANYRSVTQARFTAEAGAQAAVNFLKYSLGNGGLTSTSVAANLNVTKYPVTDTSSKPIILCSVSTGTKCATDSSGSTNGNYPVDSTQQPNFNTWIGDINNASAGINLLSGSSVAVTAKLMNVQPRDPGSGNLDYEQTWEITSQASSTMLGKPVKVQIVETAQGEFYPMFSYTVFATSSACGALTFSACGSGTPAPPCTDSYDSTATGGTCSTAPCSPLVAYTASSSTSGGNVGSNGNLLLQGGATIDGSYSTPDSGVGTCSGGAPDALSGGTATQISGGMIKLSGPVPFTDPPAPNPTPSTTAQSFSSAACPSSIPSGCSVVGGIPQLAPGSYGNLTINSIGGGTIPVQFNCPTASSPCTYNLNSIKVQGGGELAIVGGGTGDPQRDGGEHDPAHHLFGRQQHY